MKLCYFMCPTDSWLFLCGVLAHEPTDIAWWGGAGLIVTHQTNVSLCAGHLFFFSLHALLSWGSGSGFCIIFQSSTSISQPWYPTVTVTDWQDATFDCHVLYSTEPFSSRGCHQGSTSTGIAVLSVGVCLYMCATHKHSRFFFFFTCTRRLCKQHEFPVCGRVLLAGCYTWYLDSQSSAVVQVAAHGKLLKHSNT